MECDGCRNGGHFELQRHKDGRWLCEERAWTKTLLINSNPLLRRPHQGESIIRVKSRDAATQRLPMTKPNDGGPAFPSAQGLNSAYQ